MKNFVIKLSDVEVNYLTPFYFPGKKRMWEKVKALEKINLEVAKGETIALLGNNGAGKSTLLKVIAGIIKPDRGKVEINGEVRTLFELGAGFQIESSGFENVFLQGSLFGFSQKEMEKKVKKIADFASLGKYFYAPLKTYSEGMYVRLAFSIAVYTEPEIFLVDDIIAVGDIHFQEKCIWKLEEMRKEGRTLVIVTHSLPLAERLADKGIWLDKGKIIYQSNIEEVTSFYMKFSEKDEEILSLHEERLKLVFHRGKIFVFWDNQPLTAYYGGYTAIMKKEVMISPNQKWEWKKVSDKLVEGEGKFLEIPVSQLWKIKLLNERELEWKVIMNVDENIKLDEVETGMIFNKIYNYSEGKELPDYKGKEWKLFEKNESDSPFLISSYNSSLPNILWESFFKYDKKMVFLAGDYTGGKAFYWVWDKKEWRQGEHLIFEGRIKIILKKEEKSIVSFKEKGIKILWKGKLVTIHEGFDSIFEYKGKIYSSSTSKALLFPEEIKFYWKNLPFYALYCIEKKENSFNWRMEIISFEELRLKNLHIIFNFLKFFDKWITLEEEGEFFEDYKWFPSYLSFSPFLGLKGKDFPLLLSWIEGENILSFIENRKDMLVPQYFNGIETEIKKGKNVIFRGKIEFLEEEENFYKWREKKRIEILGKLKEKSIKKGNISFYINKGRGKIFYKNNEITSDWGVYTSILTEDRWQESFKGIWEIEKKSNNSLEGRSKHLFIPFLQVWNVEIRNNMINFSWDGIKNKEFKIKEIHFSFMLNKNYEKYFIGEKKFFPELKKNWGKLWEGKLNEIKIIGEKFPSLTFSGSSLYCIIKNSPSYLEGRVIEFRVDSTHINLTLSLG